MFSRIGRTARLAVAVVVLGAILAPAASAKPSRPACHQYCATVPRPDTRPSPGPAVVRTELVRDPGGFAWADAAAGFGAAVGCGAIALVLLSSRRARPRVLGRAS